MADEEQREAGPSAGQDEIAPEHQADAGAHGRPVDHGEDRLGAVVQRLRRLSVPAHHRGGVVVARVGRVQIAAGAEHPARAGEHHHPVVGALADLHEQGPERLEQLGVEGVAALGAVHRGRHHAAGPFDEQHAHQIRRLPADPVAVTHGAPGQLARLGPGQGAVEVDARGTW